MKVFVALGAALAVMFLAGCETYVEDRPGYRSGYYDGPRTHSSSRVVYRERDYDRRYARSRPAYSSSRSRSGYSDRDVDRVHVNRTTNVRNVTVNRDDGNRRTIQRREVERRGSTYRDSRTESRVKVKTKRVKRDNG